MRERKKSVVVVVAAPGRKSRRGGKKMEELDAAFCFRAPSQNFFLSSRLSRPPFPIRQNEDGRCFPPGAFTGIHPPGTRDRYLLASTALSSWRFELRRARLKGPGKGRRADRAAAAAAAAPL